MPLIIGTGGHVDHGKTLLVARLTGHDEDLDRWAEEKTRGLTIDLGFAFLDDGRGGKLAFVDVPGHEDFINNMVVGATGIDLALLVVAADDSVMPQTVEHLDIMDLLGIRDFVVAVSKVDMVDADTVQLVEEEVRELFARHPACRVRAMVRTSAREGTGLEELRAVLRATAAGLEAHADAGAWLRLPVDRVFGMKGFGTVVTGSLASGQVAVDDTVEITPQGLTARVRGIEVDDIRVDRAVRGQRTALNLAGVEKADLKRGCQVVHPGLVRPAFMLNARVQAAVSLKEPVANRRDMRFMAGTYSVPGRVEILNAEALMPGGRDILIQLRLRERVPAAAGDRFILRNLSPEFTVAGGVVLEPAVRRLTATRAADIARLRAIASAPAVERVADFLTQAPHAFHTAGEAALAFNLPLDDVRGMIAGPLAPRLVRDGERIIHREAFDLYAGRITAFLDGFHKAQPFAAGADPAALRSGLPPHFAAVLVDFVLGRLKAEGRVREDRGRLALGTFGLSLAPAEKTLADRILTVLRDPTRRYGPPTRTELAAELGPGKPFDHAWRSLVETAGVVQVERDLYFAADVLEIIRAIVRREIQAKQQTDVKSLRDILQNSRKFALALMEYFDRSGLTRRVGDIRVLREG
ncbi:MAG: selenocysteine-specific translation elongation factor [Planctomycetota bacterium]